MPFAPPLMTAAVHGETGAPAPLPSKVFVGGLNFPGDGTVTTTWLAAPVGAPGNRTLVIVATGNTAAAPAQGSVSLTVNGEVATLADQYWPPTTYGISTSMWAIKVPDGTDADIVFTSVNVWTNRVLAIYALYDLQSDTPVAAANGASTVSLAALAGGFIIAAAAAVGTVVWSGVTEDYVFFIGGVPLTVASAAVAADGIATVSYTAGTLISLSATSWR